MTEPYHIQTDVCVIGAGHAGCEAALALARNGFDTVLFTMSVESIAMMPCNPHIGGSSKGHLVREIDAMGGEMAKVIDKTFLQSKMLGVSKGPAVHSLRAQADKAEYSKEMRRILQQTPNLTIRQAEVTRIITEPANADIAENVESGENGTCADGKAAVKVCGVQIHTGTVYDCRAAIICTGTYLNARCLVGESITETGPGGMQRSTHLSGSLGDMGIGLRRFKTGTPARMDKRSLDYSKMQIQEGDPYIIPFSFSTDPESIQKEQMPCYLTYTNEETHRIIRENIDRSPIYAGIIEGTGPRYCPSIEDKVVKFPEKERHQVFVEPEGALAGEMYIDGMSSSMPDDVQQKMYRTVPGLENCVIVKNAYAIEYDCINANILKNTLETKAVENLYCAGQFNGSSGYEEAAAQGLMAGINAAMKLKGKEEIVLKRSEAYIGVLIDDLVSKDNLEPYRMMTSRAEYRLLLRQDNADLRLRKYGHQAGLVSDELYEKTCRMQEEIDEEISRLKACKLGTGEDVQRILAELGSAPVKTATSLAELLCRPELDYEKLSVLDPERSERPPVSKRAAEQVEIGIKYEGYIERQKRQVENFEKMENRRIPDSIDYDDVESLRLEARYRLKTIRPSSVGQAARLSGVSPADIAVLLVYLEKNRGNVSRET
ncbi:MAG: tRNA uridine-5-carboxymethylaminomethyl(34) synthesis enzyme MnmG [Lachnospiraceae bacterium]|nr:tRNA uridine-5-carboxymethylaminomethyl(34) synthesis enzyme MnmG [Lachnospiraceae bacterium]